MELIEKLREWNLMISLGAKIDLSKTIDELQAYIVAQQRIIDGKRFDAQWRTRIWEYKHFIRYLYLRHGCKRQMFIAMNWLWPRLDDNTIESEQLNRTLNWIYIYPLQKRNKANITFEERKNLDIL